MYETDPFEVSGNWWVPKMTGEPWRGTLRFNSSEGGHLSVMAPAPRKREHPPLGLFEPLVYGRPMHESELTLARCHESNVCWSSVGLCKREIDTRLVFRGFLLPSLDERKIKRATVSFQHLNRWVAASGMSTRGLKARSDFDFRYRTPPRQHLRVTDDLTLLMYYFPHHRTRFAGGSVNPLHPDGDFEVRERIYLRVQPRHPESWEYYERVIRVLQDFLTISMLRLSLPTTTRIEASFGPSQKIGRHRINAEAEVLSSTFYADPDSDGLDARDSLFRESDVSHGLEAALRAWFSRAESIHHARMLYSAAQYSRPTLESQFLMYCQALESYHRSLGSDRYIPTADYEGSVLPQLINAIPADLTHDLRESIRGALKYAHEYSFIRRLKLLCREHSKPLGIFFSDPVRLMREISLYRNYLVHYADPEPEFVYNGERVVALRDVAKLLLELCFLHEMGFDADATQGLMKRNLRYRRYDHWKRAQPN